MLALKRIFFPFHKTYSNLRRHWWHRLFVVLFFAVLVIVPSRLFLFFAEKPTRDHSACIDANVALNRPFDEGCEVFLAAADLYLQQGLMYGLFVAFALNYLLQISYVCSVKVIAYVAFGTTRMDREDSE